ncbi:MAG: hypothetical protein JWL90_269 [Chthoniobacteraceae bacterium]|nr:hypothetical protein [Chthoniobacteraceae bacterium]MDB6174702.1 hypothetical protein [Chthoniobacteraceae bacterium]
MKPLLTTLAAAAFLGSTAFAGPSATAGYDSKDSKKAVIEPTPADSRFLFRLTSSYVFESDFKRGDDAKGDALHNEVELGYRIPVNINWQPANHTGQWYFRLGAQYSRFDFDNSGGLPLPNTLQSAAGVVALEFITEGRIGFLLQTKPGYYFEQNISNSAFDAPTTIGFAIPFSENFYGVVGATASILRAYPVVPSLGFLWKPTPQWSIYAVAPEPRITYQPTDHFAVWAGGELVYNSFRTDSTHNRSGTLDHAVVDYSEYRAGAGLSWTVANCALEVGGGYAFQRKFDFYRAENGYETDKGAPYARVEFRAAF